MAFFVLRPGEIIGEFVDELRARRAAGDRPWELVRFLEEKGVDLSEATHYFKKAFAGRFFGFSLFAPDSGRGPIPESGFNQVVERILTEAGDAWRSAPRYPDLLCRLDREAFRAVAKGRRCHLVVQAANPFSRPYRGKPGFLPRPAGLVAVSRHTPPHAGLMALDPGDPALRALLASAEPRRSYEEQVARLRASGFEVSGPEEGQVVRDAEGRHFYPGYRLHGIYAEDTRANLWRAPWGEAIRRELNSRMGLPLVAQGPHDVWRFRNAAAAGPLRGPQPPVLWFDPTGNVSVREDSESVRENYKYHLIPWPFTEEPEP